MKPFAIRDKREVIWIRDWFSHQVREGKIALGLRAVEFINDEASAQRYIADYLDQSDRARLQKALSIRRTRKAPGTSRLVTQEMSREARRILTAVAEARGLTTSELIVETFQREADAVESRTGNRLSAR